MRSTLIADRGLKPNPTEQVQKLSDTVMDAIRRLLKQVRSRRLSVVCPPNENPPTGLSVPYPRQVRKPLVRHWKVYYGGFWHHFLDFRRYAPARREWGYCCIVELVRVPQPMVRRVYWEEVLVESGGRPPVLVRERSLDAASIFERARRKLNGQSYNLVFYNCEHFANECMIRRRQSRQVRTRVAQAFSALGGGAASAMVLTQSEMSTGSAGLGLASGLAALACAFLFGQFVVQSVYSMKNGQLRRRQYLSHALQLQPSAPAENPIISQ